VTTDEIQIVLLNLQLLDRTRPRAARLVVQLVAEFVRQERGVAPRLVEGIIDELLGGQPVPGRLIVR
jgi:hypothetical protein